MSLPNSKNGDLHVLKKLRHLSLQTIKWVFIPSTHPTKKFVQTIAFRSGLQGSLVLYLIISAMKEAYSRCNFGDSSVFV